MVKDTIAIGSMVAQSAAGKKFDGYLQDYLAQFAEAGATMAHKLTRPEVFSTGSIELDYALETGGLLRGRIVTYQGEEDVGKTSLCMLAVASAQRAYPEQINTWVDAENTFDERRAAALGVDLRRLVIVPKPSSAEECANAVHKAIFSGYNATVTLDSIGAMLGEAERQAMAEDAKVAEVARVMTRLTKQAAGIGNRNGTTLLLVNQNRSKIAAGAHANATTQPGGRGVKYLTSMRFVVSKTWGADGVRELEINGANRVVGFKSTVKVDKNKAGGPNGATADIWIYSQRTDKYGPPGVGLAEEAVSLGALTGVIAKKGSYHTLPDGTRYNGAPATAEALRQKPELIEKIRERVIASIAHKPGELPDGASVVELLAELPEEDVANG